MSEELVLWHDFNVSLVTASAGLLGLLFVAGIGVLSLVWGVFNTWELIFRVQGLDQP